jgi:hypothetical protein
MFVDLPPDSPNQAPVVMVAEARQGQKPAATMRTVGVCMPMANLQMISILVEQYLLLRELRQTTFTNMKGLI